MSNLTVVGHEPQGFHAPTVRRTCLGEPCCELASLPRRTAFAPAGHASALASTDASLARAGSLTIGSSTCRPRGSLSWARCSRRRSSSSFNPGGSGANARSRGPTMQLRYAKRTVGPPRTPAPFAPSTANRALSHSLNARLRGPRAPSSRFLDVARRRRAGRVRFARRLSRRPRRATLHRRSEDGAGGSPPCPRSHAKTAPGIQRGVRRSRRDSR